jgi:hypothetical protein
MFGRRLISLASLCLLTNRSATNVVNVVNAVNSDKVSFQIFEIDSPLLDIMWCGNTREVILVQSEKGTIYRSRDRGESWKKLHSIMHQTGLSVIDEGLTESYILWLDLYGRPVGHVHFSRMSLFSRKMELPYFRSYIQPSSLFSFKKRSSLFKKICAQSEIAKLPCTNRLVLILSYKENF